MTDEEISKLTLGDLERIAERFGKAVADIRAAQALFGMGAGTSMAPATAEETAGPPPSTEPEDPIAAHRRRQFQPVEMDQPRALRTRSPVNDPLRRGPTAADIAERNRLMGRQAVVDPNLPEDIAAMERGE